MLSRLQLWRSETGSVSTWHLWIIKLNCVISVILFNMYRYSTQHSYFSVEAFLCNNESFEAKQWSGHITTLLLVQLFQPLNRSRRGFIVFAWQCCPLKSLHTCSNFCDCRVCGLCPSVCRGKCRTVKQRSILSTLNFAENTSNHHARNFKVSPLWVHACTQNSLTWSCLTAGIYQTHV